MAEFNIWADPVAARIVFESGMPLTMVGWDVSHTYAVFEPDEAARLRRLGTPLAKFCVDIQRVVDQFALNVTRLEGFDLPDPMAMAVALDPTVATRTKRLHVSIEASSTSCRGQTIVDHLQITGREPNVNVVLEASRERFLSILHQSLKE